MSLFSGSSGSGNGSREAHSTILAFLVRFLIFYAACTIVWLLIHTYYESLLWFVTIKASQLLGQPAFSNPQIIGNSYYYRLGNATFVYDSISAITLTFLITFPLLLASSGFSLLQRTQIVLMGLSSLFAFHVLSLLIALYANLYNQYPMLLQKGVNIDKILAYSPEKDLFLAKVHRFFNVIFKFVVAVGIWIGLVSWYKKSVQQYWVRKLM